MEYPLFDRELSEQRKQDGMQVAADNAPSALFRVQQIARDIGRRQRFVSSDDVVREMTKHGITSKELGNAAGKMFSSPEWHDTDRTVRSERVSAKRRKITIWEYRGN